MAAFPPPRIQRFFEFRAWGAQGRIHEDSPFAVRLHAVMLEHQVQHANADLAHGAGVGSAFATFRAWGAKGRIAATGTFAAALTALMTQHGVDWVVAERTGEGR